MSRHHVTPADRRLMRWLPLTLLLQRQTDQPARLWRDHPQLHRLLRAGLIVASYDASPRAITLSISARGEEARQGVFALPPASVLPDPRR